MFFGSVESAVDLCWTGVVDMLGYGSKIDAHFEELSADELKVCMTVIRCAYKYAKEMDMPEKVLEAIVLEYDRVFELVAISDGVLKKAILGRKHKYLGGFQSDNVDKYWRLAGLL